MNTLTVLKMLILLSQLDVCIQYHILDVTILVGYKLDVSPIHYLSMKKKSIHKVMPMLYKYIMYEISKINDNSDNILSLKYPTKVKV